MNRTLLLPLSACLLFASCVTTYSTSRKYVAVDTPEGETVVMNGDTLRYGLTPRDMALELGVEPSGKNLARMSRIVYAANSPQTAYGFYDATPEPLSVEIHAADTHLLLPSGSLQQRPLLAQFPLVGDRNVRRPRQQQPLRTSRPLLDRRRLPYLPQERLDAGRTPAIPVRTESHRKTRGRRATRYANSFQKGRVNVSLAFPWLQLYSFSPVSTGIRRNNGGCIGIAAGIEYLYRDKRGIALETSALAGYATIWGPAASIDPPPNEEWSAIHISLAEYFHFRRFTVGYGLNAARNKYTYKPPYPGFGTNYLGDTRLDDRYWAAGIMVAAYINITPKIMFGATYRPTFFQFGTTRPWRYEHSATLDLKFYLFRK